MKLFKFTSYKVVDAYAKELANDFFRLCAQPGSSASNNKLFEKKVEQALIGIFAQVKIFRKEHHLGIFNRARFAKVFQDEMMRMGYAPELVNEVTTALVAAALSGD